MSRSIKNRGALFGAALGIGATLVIGLGLLAGAGAAASTAAPQNTSEPEISGSAAPGKTLAATTGTWSNDPTSFAFQWLRCPQSGGQGDGSDCGQIAGATTSTYTLAGDDVGFTIRVRVTATNADGSASAASNPSSIVQAAAAAPVSAAAPQIAGSAVQGQTLTATAGAWSNNPTSFAFQWLRCPRDGGRSNGSNCALIAGATANSYALAAADVGLTIRIRVIASNIAGSASAVSKPTRRVEGVSAPKNTVPPTVSATPIVGRVLTMTPGKWSGTQPIGYGYQWLRCDRNGGGCVSITGAVGLTWRVLPASVGHTIRARVTATNAGGTSQATSTPTAIVTGTATAPPPPSPPSAAGCPAGSGAVTVDTIGSPARLLIDRQQTSPSVVKRGTRRLTVRYHVSACGGRSVKGARVYATAVPFNQLNIPDEQKTGSDGWASLDFRMLAGFPVSPKQGLIAIFARARKSGENPLGGMSTRRLFSVHVNLNG